MSADLPTRFDEGLRARSRSSIGWTVTRFLSDQIFSFVVFVILARLLTQADIGAFAVMAVTAEAFRIIATAGLVQTIARKNQITPAFLDTIYRSQQAFSFLSALLIMALAQPIARGGKRVPQRYRQRTPAMAAGLTSRRWTVRDLLTVPLLPEPVGAG